MPRGVCHRHGPDRPCSCAMGKLYRFVEPVLLYLLKKKGRSHGYELAGALEEYALTDAAIERGALYRTLNNLEQNGYVVSEWDTSGSGPARRQYRLTPAGEEHLQEWALVLDQLATAMARLVANIHALPREGAMIEDGDRA